MLFVRILFLLSLLSLGSFCIYQPESPSENFRKSVVVFPPPQQLAAQKYFGKVIDLLPNTIVGNFGEPRKLHFHTGLDFRTNQEEGHVVFAAADGYVSRINVLIFQIDSFALLYNQHLNQHLLAIQSCHLILATKSQ